MTIILNRYTGRIMFEDEKLSFSELVINNKYNLSGANLLGADLENTKF